MLSLGAVGQANLTINPVINSPLSGCYLSNSQLITVVLVNVSAFPYSGTCEMGYILNGGAPVTQNVTIGFMPASGTFIYSWPVPADFSSCQVHTLKAWVWDVNDPNNLNDTINTTVISDCDPIPGWLTGPNPVCSGINSGEYTLNGSYGNAANWATSTDNGLSWSWTGTTDTFLTYSNVVSETQVKVIVASPYGYCASDTTTIFTQAVDAQSDAGILTPDFDICDNGNSGWITTIGFTGNIIDWNLSTNAGGGWIPLSTPNDSVAYNNLVDTTWYRVIVKNGVCPADTSGPVIATLILGTIPGTIIGESLVCNFQNDSSLLATGGYGDVIAWWVSLDSGVTWLPTTDTDSIFDYQGLGQGTLFGAEWQFGSCPSAWSIHYITVLPVTSGITPDTTINEGDAIQLNACCGVNYLWWPNTFIDYTDIYNPIVNPDADITYFVRVTDISGCIDTARIVVTVLPDISTLVIPNLFTPNSDGYNDNWEIGNIAAFTENELTIFNIYGQVIYDITPYNNEWDGTYNGNKLPDGTYFYLLRLNDPLYVEPIQGVITIAGND